MEITRKNYEAFFIDYLEGNLDESRVDEFIEFLLQNPDLKEELELFKEVAAVPETVAFQKKETLYKEKYDLESEFDKAAVACLEGDISKTEKTEFDRYLSVHPEKQKDAALFSHTILKADENIHFDKKQKLYKKTSRQIVLLWTGRVAAVLILGLAIFGLLDNRKNTNAPTERVAEVKKEMPGNEIIPETKAVENDLIPFQETHEVKNAEKPVALKSTTVQKTEKSSSPRTETGQKEELLYAGREAVEIPKTLDRVNASFERDLTMPELASVHQELPVQDKPLQDEWLISDEIREKINLKNIGRAGLNLVANLSNERFRYETDQKGHVTEFRFDSRLLAFSIPVTPSNPE